MLLTGFEPFDGAQANPSERAARRLHGRQVARHRVVGAVLPTRFSASIDRLNQLIDRHRPALILCLGLAGGRSALSFERIAINVDDARIPDNAGDQPVDRPVVPGGPAAYFSSLPIKSMVTALARAGLPAEVSQTAGTFVCNHVFYGLMHRLGRDRALRGTRGGFVHLPWLPGQGEPALDEATQAKGLRLAIEAALRNPRDIAVTGGATH